MEEGQPSAPPRPDTVDRLDTVERLCLAHANRIKLMTSRTTDCGVLCFTIFCLILCGVFFLFCPRCIFGVLILSACLCPFFNSMNAPLWLAIVLLTVSGWSFTGGAFSISWNAHAV